MTVTVSCNVDGHIDEETLEKIHRAVASLSRSGKNADPPRLIRVNCLRPSPIGGIIAHASDGAVAALRHWLQIN
jgi:hypothetical protein